MIRLEVMPDETGKGGTTKIEIKGMALDVMAEISALMSSFAEKHKELIGPIFVGFAEAGLDKDELIDEIKSAYRAIELSKLVEKFDIFDKKPAKNAKKVDKTDEKCENSSEKDIKSLLKLLDAGEVIEKMLSSFDKNGEETNE